MLDILDSWKRIDLDALHGTLLVVGGPDTGKSTFARYLFQALQERGHHAAFLDGDPGQSFLGPPTTLNLAFDLAGGQLWRYFTGSITPWRHMLPVVVGGARLVQTARAAGADSLVYDTSGLVDPQQGGLALKSAKIDLLRPAMIFAIQRQQELEPLLLPLRRSRRVQVVDLHPSAAVARRDPLARREYRSRQFARHFAQSLTQVVDWKRMAIFPLPLFRPNRLVALEDEQGFTLGLGIVRQIDYATHCVTLWTPLASMEKVNALRLGDILLNPETFQDEKIE